MSVCDPHLFNIKEGGNTIQCIYVQEKNCSIDRILKMTVSLYIQFDSIGICPGCALDGCYFGLKRENMLST
jgi:hypothetical protein